MPLIGWPEHFENLDEAGKKIDSNPHARCVVLLFQIFPIRASKFCWPVCISRSRLQVISKTEVQDSNHGKIIFLIRIQTLKRARGHSETIGRFVAPVPTSLQVFIQITGSYVFVPFSFSLF